MATSPDVVRAQLATISTAAVTDLLAEASSVALEDQLRTLLEALGLVVPTYYDAAGLLAVAWYEELRDESRPTSAYTPTVIGDPSTDWIEREIAKFQAQIDLDLEQEMQRL